MLQYGSCQITWLGHDGFKIVFTKNDKEKKTFSNIHHVNLIVIFFDVLLIHFYFIF